jgi:hypothetical protein
MYGFIILHSYFLNSCCSYRRDTIEVWRFSLCNILFTEGFAPGSNILESLGESDLRAAVGSTQQLSLNVVMIILHLCSRALSHAAMTHLITSLVVSSVNGVPKYIYGVRNVVQQNPVVSAGKLRKMTMRRSRYGLTVSQLQSYFMAKLCTENFEINSQTHTSNQPT